MFPPSPTSLRGIPKKASYSSRKTLGPYGPGHGFIPQPWILYPLPPPPYLFEKANGINIQNIGGLKIHKHAIYILRALPQAVTI